ncbi:dihydrodipicolinate synthase family protein [Curtobacterium ammoniigenes]|uniref:dihydrodipicolinate synthase family protein n=1 Tax=Curtobacterium ammoniigenes TaxID=395387 RepID=UPI00082C1101|nr:dihydrodipicolinate synthase family protein [Curtobacterium ammoniigenes]
MFSGLSAFPLTPFRDSRVDFSAFGDIVDRAAGAGVDSIGALGSTGSYPYLTVDERRHAASVAVAAANGVPVIVGVGALTLRDVLANVEHAQNAGASAVLLSVVTYQPLTDSEVIAFIADVAREASIPVCLYDNPRTTHVHFTDSMYAEVAAIPGIQSIKLPGAPGDAFAERLRSLRALVPDTVTLGVSGDAFGADALLNGADVWYSALAGTLPDELVALARAAQSGDRDRTAALNTALEPIWTLFADHGSYRVIAHIARLLGLTDEISLPRPVLPLRDDIVAAIDAAIPDAAR